MFRGFTPVSHTNLKTDGMDYRSAVGKQSNKGLTLLNVIDFSTKGFLEILSYVLIAHERSLSFTYGSPDESCISFTLMYCGKCKASQINLFRSH